MWGVFLLFTIPIGGGIPAGVALADKRGLGMATMCLLYFLSDVVLAFSFEPLVWLFSAAAKRSPFLARVGDAMRRSVELSTAHYGTGAGPLALILIAFGVDPMTGRAAARAAGHGFLSGWAIAIAGDMLYFSVIMASTLWLNSVLGDGTKTMVIVMIAMFAVPELVKRWRERRGKPAA